MAHWNGCWLKIAALPAITHAVTLIASIGAAAAADKRVALVIGNSAYRSVTPLPNPSKDAAAIGAMFRRTGFDVVDSKEDLSGADMRRMIRDFSDKVRDADIAVVFYAGHGIEVDGTNYLLPVDTRLERDIDVEDEAISLERVTRILEPARKLRLVILDACRDNPFTRTMKRSLSSRAVERGLVKVEPTSPNTLVAYAAKAGSTAADGAGANSPFTAALLKQLAVPGQDIRRSFGYVRDEVLAATGNRQEPFVYGSLGGADVTLVPATENPAIPPQVAALDPDSRLRRDYELAAQVNTKPAWDAFIAAHPSGFYADLAKAARGKLTTGGKTAAVDTRSPAPPPRDSSPYAGFENYSGRSFQLNYSEAQDEVSPSPGLKRVRRELTIYVKSADEISSRLRLVRRDPTKSTERFAQSPLGDIDRGIQVTYADGKLTQTVLTSSFRLKTSVTARGNACQASIGYELLPGKDRFDLRNLQGELMNVRAITAENIGCKASKGNAVGPVPTASARP